MKENNQTLEQAAKAAKKNGNSQLWKNALATTLGLGVGVAAYPIINPEPPTPPVPPTPTPDQPVAKTSAKPQPAPHHDDHQHDAQPVAKSIPEFAVYDHEVITTANGSQMDVAFGVTANGRNCMIVDSDMDGIADTFYEDVNGNLVFEEAEGISLSGSKITVSMNHLTELEIDTTPEPTVEEPVVVVAPDPEVVIDKPENDDDVIAVVDGESNLPDYTNDEITAAPEDDHLMADNSADMAPIDDPVIA